MNLGPQNLIAKHKLAQTKALASSSSLIQLGQPRRFRENILIGLSLLVFAWIATRFDIAIANFSLEDTLPGDMTRVLRLTEVFAHGFGLAVVLIGIWILTPERRRQIPRLFACAGFPPVTANIIKVCIGRRRPTTYMDLNQVAEFPSTSSSTWVGWMPNESWNIAYGTQAFPSAHAALVCGLAIGMTFLFPRGRWLFLVLAIMASFQRVASYAHWPSDVLVGAAIGFIVAGGLTQNWGIGYLCGRIEQAPPHPIS